MFHIGFPRNLGVFALKLIRCNKRQKKEENMLFPFVPLQYSSWIYLPILKDKIFKICIVFVSNKLGRSESVTEF